MDFLLENEGKPVPDLASVSASSSSQPSAGAAGEDDDEELAALRAVYGKKAGNDAGALEAAAAADAEPKVRQACRLQFGHMGLITDALYCVQSIKCSECGKVFRNTALAQYHAEKSGHDQFEESTEEARPCTFTQTFRGH